MEFSFTNKTVFNSIRYGQIDMESVVWKILSYISEDPNANYVIAVGTDSMTHNHKGTKFAVVITVHREGKGAIFFYKTIKTKPIVSLFEKVDEETKLSVNLANYLLKSLGTIVQEETSHVRVVIHMDVGKNGPTSQFVDYLESYVKGYRYDFAIKPDSYAASTIADMISK